MRLLRIGDRYNSVALKCPSSLKGHSRLTAAIRRQKIRTHPIVRVTLSCHVPDLLVARVRGWRERDRTATVSDLRVGTWNVQYGRGAEKNRARFDLLAS